MKADGFLASLAGEHGLAAVVAGLFALWLALVAFRPRQSREIREVLKVTREHLEALTKAYNRTAYVDDYGEVNHARWAKELKYFIRQKFAADIADAGEQKARVDKLYPTVSEFFLAHARNLQAAPRESHAPIDFEVDCAARLKSAGWQTRLTRQSGDQGVDIIAEACGCTAVFQCKSYTGPAGNAAVQEVVAGRGFYDAALSGVIAKSGFTPAARMLAQKNDVLLLSPDDLPALKICTRRKPCPSCGFGHIVEWKERQLKRCLQCGR